MKRLIESLRRRFQSRRDEPQGAETQAAAHADFLPALQAIEQTPPHPLPRLMIGTIAALAGIGIVAYAWRGLGSQDNLPELELRNPTEIRTALTFGVIYALVLLFSAATP